MSNKNNKATKVIGMRIEQILVEGLAALIIILLVGASPVALLAMQNESRIASKETHKMTITDLQELFYKVEIEEKINVEFENETLKEALAHIAGEAGLKLTYRGDIMVENEVSLQNESISVSEALEFVLEGTGLDYKFSRDGYLLIGRINELNELEVYQETITGRVIDSQTEEALPGVNIVVQGTTTGTSTNVDGEFELNVPSLDVTLVVSFIGYGTQEISVEGRTTIDIEMLPQAISGEELVVIGYGSARRIDLTGSVGRVDINEMSELPNVSVIQALQGAVPGLNVGAVEQAGENPEISVRSRNTLSRAASDNAPLIVVDGAIYRGSIIDLNPADIESVDILKDASSTAIYGSQASNGVLLITTKTGAQDSRKPTINYSGSYTLQVPSNTIEPMGRAEYTEFFPDVFWSGGGRLEPDYLQPNPDFSVVPFLKTNELATGFSQGIETDWYGDFTGNGYNNSHNLSVGGRSNQIGYFFSGGITDVEGFVHGDNYQRINYRMNLDAEIVDWLDIGIKSFLTSSDYSGVSPPLSSLFHMQPFAPARDDDGELIRAPEGSMINPFLFEQTQEHEDLRLNIFADIYAEIQLPIEGLSHRVNYSQNYFSRKENRFNELGADFSGSGFKYFNENYDWIFDNVMTYINTFSEVHRVTGTLVFGLEKRTDSFTNTNVSGFPNPLLGFNSLEAGDPNQREIDTGRGEETSIYSMGRLIYSYNDKYLFTGTLRRDGFSGFGEEQKIGIFPSVAVGWVASGENFMQANWVDYLKFRVSYGQSGRRGVGRYDTKAIVSSSPQIVFGDGGSPVMGQWISKLANNRLGWETTTSLNFGVDFDFLNSALYGNINYYFNNTTDILFAIQLPGMTGFSDINTNIGEVSGQGLEIELNSQIINTSDLNWNVGVNFSRNRDEVVSIIGDITGDGKEDDLVADRLFVGHPIGVNYDYVIEGIWQFEDQQAGNIPDGFSVGQYRLADLNGDGVISAADRKILHYQDPGYRIGISNRINYKQFSMYVFINSIQGGKDYFYGPDTPYIDKFDQLTYQNIPRGASSWDYWMPENPDARFRRLDLPSQFNPDRYLQRNFIRIQDVSLSYTFDSNWIPNVNNLRIFVSGKNLATFTKWRGWDPETGRTFSPGIPVMKSYSFGVNLEF
ncbi:MAG: SusC/RagA family TonB-linked outer membrane protein [Cyclobacteriaceae bacterium]